MMSTARRFQWLKFLCSLTLLIGLSVSASAEDDGIPEMSVVEQAFWICLQDHEATITPNGAQCCDGAACYTCWADFSECWISNDTSSSSQRKPELRSEGAKISPMQERPSEGQLQSVCTSVKANFTLLKGFGFSCLKPNCDGKGNDCSIVCHDDRRCAAQTPDVIRHAMSLRGILQNGDNIDRSVDEPSGSSGGSDSKGSESPDDDDDDDDGGPILY